MSQSPLHEIWYALRRLTITQVQAEHEEIGCVLKVQTLYTFVICVVSPEEHPTRWEKAGSIPVRIIMKNQEAAKRISHNVMHIISDDYDTAIYSLQNDLEHARDHHYGDYREIIELTNEHLGEGVLSPLIAIGVWCLYSNSYAAGWMGFSGDAYLRQLSSLSDGLFDSAAIDDKDNLKEMW